MFNTFHNSIVQICDPDGMPVGCGVIIDKVRVITCSHVVAKSFGKSIDANAKLNQLPENGTVGVRRVYVDGHDATPLTTTITTYRERRAGVATSDIAVLTLQNSEFDLSTPITPFIKLGRESAKATNFSCVGFPDDVKRTVEEADQAHYLVRDISGHGWYFTISQPEHDSPVRPGFSGGPAVSEATNKIIGIISEAHVKNNSANVIPTELICQVVDFQTESEEDASDDGLQLQTQIKGLTKPGLRIILDNWFPRLHSKLTEMMRPLETPAELSTLRNYILETHAQWKNELREKTIIPGPGGKQITSAGSPLSRKQRPFDTPIQQFLKEVAGLSSGGDSSSAQITALSKQTRRVKNLVKKLLNTEEPIMVLGEPGSGKSLTMKQAAIEVARINRNKVFPTVCVFIPLGKWKPVSHPEIADVERLVSNSVPVELRSLLPELCQHGRLVVIFDGLDEMSRKNYTEHTEALSTYADKYQDVRTLFSCRIADFSPAFKHHRIVLMPFQRKHIQLYLQRHFGHEGVVVDGVQVKPKDLAKRLDREDMAIQPHNPFSLWLLCLYLGENNKMPPSRVELLLFSFQYQFRQKRDEKERIVFPDENEFFGWIAELAYHITLLNKGTDIELQKVWDKFGRLTDEMIRIGTICNVLQESTDHSPTLIRFVHHRAQEFFTARHIVESSANLDWNKYFDIPRWQETIINISQMEASRSPVVELTVSLESGLDQIKASSDDKLKAALLETKISERVEFASRVALNLPKSDSPDILTFHEALENLVIELSWVGNPVSKIKMLKVVQTVPNISNNDVIDRLVLDKVDWVREQAQVVSANISGNPAATNIPQDVINSFGNGSLVPSLFQKIGVAKRLKSMKAIVVMIVAALLVIFQSFVIVMIAPVISYLTVDFISSAPKFVDGKVLSDMALYFFKYSPLVVLAMSTLLHFTGSLIFFDSRRIWLSAFGGLVAYVVLLVIFYFWAFNETATLKGILIALAVILFGTYFYRGILIGLFFLCFLPFWFIPSLLMALIMSLWTKRISSFSATLSGTWSQSGMGSYFDDLIGGETKDQISLIFYSVFGCLVTIVVIIIEKSPTLTEFFDRYFPHLPFALRFFDFLTFACIYLVVPFSLIQLVRWKMRSRNYWDTETIAYLFFSPVIAYVAGLIARGFGFLFELIFRFIFWLIDLVSGWFPDSGAIAGYVLAIILMIIITGFIAMCSYKLYVFIKNNYFRFITVNNKQQFMSAMQQLSPRRQSDILRQVTPKKLNLPADEFLIMLIEAESAITEEPALSTYYQRRAEYQDLLRHERNQLHDAS